MSNSIRPQTGPKPMQTDGAKPQAPAAAPAQNSAESAAAPENGATQPRGGTPPNDTASQLSLKRDVFDSGRGPQFGIDQPLVSQSPYAAKLNQATDRFSTRVQKTLGHDAMSLAEGKPYWKPGDPLSDAQRSHLQNATVDYVQDIPLGFMSPKIASKVENGLQAAGLDVKHVEGKTLRELQKDIPDAAQDVAKDMARQLKEKSPTAYYGLMAGGLAAVGGVAYSKGTEPLEKLGIKPEMSTNLFNDSVRVKAEASWKEKFSDLNLKSTVSGQVKLNRNDKLDLSATTHFANGGLQKGHFDTRLSLGRDMNFSSRLGFDATGLNDVSLGHQMHLGHGGSLSTQLRIDEQGAKDMSMGYQLSGGANHLSINSQLRHNFQTDRTTANVSALYSSGPNFEAAVSLSIDSKQESRIGFGATWRF